MKLTTLGGLYGHVKNNEKLIARRRVKLDIDEASRELRNLVVVVGDSP